MTKKIWFWVSGFFDLPNLLRVWAAL